MKKISFILFLIINTTCSFSQSEMTHQAALDTIQRYIDIITSANDLTIDISNIGKYTVSKEYEKNKSFEIVIKKFDTGLEVEEVFFYRGYNVVAKIVRYDEVLFYAYCYIADDKGYRRKLKVTKDYFSVE